jgi:hypothetical protein
MSKTLDLQTNQQCFLIRFATQLFMLAELHQIPANILAFIKDWLMTMCDACACFDDSSELP